MKQLNWQRITLLAIIGLALVLSFLASERTRANPPEATQTRALALATPDRLTPPPMPANPTQADYGAQVYNLRCMACHGDRGQGLTREWRAAWDLEDQNCWQSKCHAANHPSWGFVVPDIVPPVIGEGTLPRFQTAADLKAFICAKMPWYAPGSLDETTCWQLTAFLLRANGIPLGQAPLGPGNAAQIRLTRATEQPSVFPSTGLVLGIALVSLGTVALLSFVLKRRRV